MQAASTPLALAAAVGYHIASHLWWVTPLRARYAGDIALLVSPADAESAQLQAFASEQRVLLEPNRCTSHRFYLCRWSEYARLCVAPYTHCLVSDFRDVFFAGNPFGHAGMRLPRGHARAAAVTLALEHPSTPLGKCVFNRLRLKECYGLEGVDRVGNFSIVNAGVVLANPAGLASIAALMSTGSSYRRSSKCVMDQAILNYALYTGYFADAGVSVELEASGAGAVQVFSYVPRPEMRARLGEGGGHSAGPSDHAVVNLPAYAPECSSWAVGAGGRLACHQQRRFLPAPAVLHMHDREPALSARLAATVARMLAARPALAALLSSRPAPLPPAAGGCTSLFRLTKLTGKSFDCFPAGDARAGRGGHRSSSVASRPVPPPPSPDTYPQGDARAGRPVMPTRGSGSYGCHRGEGVVWVEGRCAAVLSCENGAIVSCGRVANVERQNCSCLPEDLWPTAHSAIRQ